MQTIIKHGRKLKPEENDKDFYPTPKWCTEALMGVEDFSAITYNPTVWECCCGNGDISEVLKDHNIPVLSTDIRYTNYTTGGIDVLKRPPFIVEHVITNPPYFCATEIIKAALSIATGKVCMFLRLSFLESKCRKQFFEEYTPIRMYVFRDRVTTYPGGIEAPGRGTVAYAWFIWEPGYKGNHIQTRWVDKPTMNEK